MTALTARQIAERWQISATEVYRMAQRGDLKAFRAGRTVRFWLKDIESFERANTS